MNHNLSANGACGGDGGGGEQPEAATQSKESLREEVYKKALSEANSYQQLAAEKKKDELRRLRAAAKEHGIMQDVGRNPLELLPKEIWLKVFGHLKDCRTDLKSCENTCQLFQILLAESKAQRMFGEILPIMADRYLNVKETLTCRQVCKLWMLQVDKHQRDKDLFSLTNMNSYKQLTFGTDTRVALRQRMDEMRRHGGNPFIGGSVWIDIMEDEFYGEFDENGELVEEGLEEQNQSFVTAFVEDVTYFLNSFGVNITKLALWCCPHYALTPSRCCPLFLLAIAHCRYLKSVTVGFWNFHGQVIDNDQLSAMIPAGFSVSPHLETLEFQDERRGLGVVQNLLLRHCSSQLKCFKPSEWIHSTPGLASFEWKLLEQLDLSGYEDIKSLTGTHGMETLIGMEAPELKKLWLYLRPGTSLEALLQMINSFPNLNYLKIKLDHLENSTSVLPFTMKEIAAVPTGLRAPDCLKTLDFSVTSSKMPNFKPEMENYDFLVLFPFVEELQVRAWEPADTHQLVEDNPAKNELVEMSHFWIQEHEIYNSNVWRLLPFLQTVKVEINGRSPFPIVYTREAYDAFLKFNARCKSLELDFVLPVLSNLILCRESGLLN